MPGTEVDRAGPRSASCTAPPVRPQVRGPQVRGPGRSAFSVRFP